MTILLFKRVPDKERHSLETTSLQLTSDIVGTRCAPLEIEITPRMIMNYAAGIGDKYSVRATPMASRKFSFK